MQFTAATVLALVATVSASYAAPPPPPPAAYPISNSTSTSVSVVSYTTEVHSSYTTVCPYATTVTFNGVTYPASASQTLTITNCPCTVVKPVTTSCPPAAPGHNATATGTSYALPKPTHITTNGGNTLMVGSGISLAGLIAAVAMVL